MCISRILLVTLLLNGCDTLDITGKADREKLRQEIRLLRIQLADQQSTVESLESQVSDLDSKVDELEGLVISQFE